MSELVLKALKSVMHSVYIYFIDKGIEAHRKLGDSFKDTQLIIAGWSTF